MKSPRPQRLLLAGVLLVAAALFADYFYAVDSSGAKPKRVPRAPAMPAKISGSDEVQILGEAARDIREVSGLSLGEGIEVLAKLPPGDRTRLTYKETFRSWARNPELTQAAAEAAYALADYRNRQMALEGVLLEWCSADRTAALDWAIQHSEVDAEPLALALTRLSDGDAKFAAQYVDYVKDAAARAEVIGKIADNWSFAWKNGTPNDPAAAIDWLDQVAEGDGIYDKNVLSIVAHASKVNPAAATSLLDHIADTQVRQQAMVSLATQWVKSDPSASLAWAQSLPESGSGARTAVEAAIVAAWAEVDSAAALKFIQTSANSAVFLAQAPVLAQALARDDPSSALNYVNTLPAGEAKAQAFANVLAVVANKDADAAWQYAAALPAADRSPAAMGSLIHVMAAKDPVKAAEWLAQLPMGDAQVSATRSVAAAWSLTDPDAFIQWVNRLPTGAARSVALTAATDAAKSSKLPEASRAALATKFAHEISLSQ